MTPRKIVVVDNDPAIRAFASLFLRKEGYEVAPAEDGLSALKILENWAPDVMFIDLVMPNISGEKLCAIIRNMERFKDTYLVMLSAVSAEEQVRYVEYGFDAMIAKGPLKTTGEHLLSILKQLEAGTLSHSDHPALGLEGLRRREITKELLSNSKHYELILANVSEGVIEVAADGRIVYANPAVTSLLEVPETKLLGAPFIALFTGLDRELVLGHLRDESAAARKVGPVTLQGHRVAMTMLRLADSAQRSRVVILDAVAEQHGTRQKP